MKHKPTQTKPPSVQETTNNGGSRYVNGKPADRATADREKKGKR